MEKGRKLSINSPAIRYMYYIARPFFPGGSTPQISVTYALCRIVSESPKRGLKEKWAELQ